MYEIFDAGRLCSSGRNSKTDPSLQRNFGSNGLLPQAAPYPSFRLIFIFARVLFILLHSALLKKWRFAMVAGLLVVHFDIDLLVQAAHCTLDIVLLVLVLHSTSLHSSYHHWVRRSDPCRARKQISTSWLLTSRPLTWWVKIY